MKNLFLGAIFFGLSLLSARIASAQGYIPDYFYYPPYAYETPYGDPQAYDPYYELHTLHYQLYLPPYQYYSYCCAPTVIVPPAPPPIIIRPAPRGGVTHGTRR
ncbi:MAG TPA: hypothetical protein VL754_19980 [Verrucomicrobiae bacterium]|jgi:hypothetical protein|nr:hypothetical protein [Verrucomicrobiae bacterium]